MRPTPVLHGLDHAALSGPVAQALGCAAVEIVDWQQHALTGGSAEAVGEAQSALYRLVGTAVDRGGTVLPWTLVLKRLAPLSTDDDPAAPAYWKREVLAYQSGLLTDLPGGVVAPRCFGVQEQPDGSAWLWLEDLTDAARSPWSHGADERAAHHLGRFNAAYVVGRPVPTAPWLSTDWLRACLAQAAPAVSHLAHLREHPLVREVVTVEMAARVERLWAQRDAFLGALEGLPRTFCHLDAFRRNMFLRQDAAGESQLVLIDWAFAGRGALGEELASCVVSPICFFDVPLEELPQREDVGLRGYVAGLREAGWRGDEGIVRCAYAITVALRYGLAVGPAVLTMAGDPQSSAVAERVSGQSLEQIIARISGIMIAALDRAHEVERGGSICWR